MTMFRYLLLLLVLTVGFFTSRSDDGKSTVLKNKEYLLSDLRATIVEPEAVIELSSKSSCRILFGETKVQIRDVSVGKGIELETLLSQTPSHTDSQVVVFKLNSIQRIAPWFAAHTAGADDRAKIGKTVMVSGDVVWILPRN
jgi:hypothetical protein